jgi:hypothetical protein
MAADLGFMSRIAFAALLLTLPLVAEERLTNNDIIQMVQAGVAEDLIVGTIKEAMPGYSFMPVHLVVLKKAGVSDEVVRAMAARQHSGWERPTAAPVVKPETRQTVSIGRSGWEEWYLRPGRAELGGRMGFNAGPGRGQTVKFSGGLETAVAVHPAIALIGGYAQNTIGSGSVTVTDPYYGSQSLKAKLAWHEFTGGVRFSAPWRVSPYGVLVGGLIYQRATADLSGIVDTSIAGGEAATPVTGAGFGMNIGITRQVGVQSELRVLTLPRAAWDWYGRATFGAYYRFH